MGERIVKVPLPVELIRRMDEAIVGQRGGFQTRAELMREAVENLLTELDFPPAPAEPRLVNSRAGAVGLEETVGPGSPQRGEPIDALAHLLSGLPPWERDEMRIADLVDTAIKTTDRPALVSAGTATTRNEPLLGLHNRDYVSVWALQRLARYTSGGPIPFQDYLQRVTRAAWFVGSQLQALEATSGGRKLAVLFPTNAMKQPSAERGFQSFAIGAVKAEAGRSDLRASGPLFAWKAIEVIPEHGLPTGLTESGWQLLSELEGLSLDLPHRPEAMSVFMAHLKRHAPGDRWGFDHVAAAAAESPDRQGLVRSFADAHPEWSPATASSVAQGYIARAREWGLIEPKLVDGRYWLTNIGRRFVSDLD